MKAQNDRFYQKSFDFIINNINATSDSIPLSLLEYWIDIEYKNDLTSKKENKKFCIFMMAYCTNEAKKENSEFCINIEHLKKLYYKYQYFLIREFIRRKIGGLFNPIPIFKFENYEENLRSSLN